MQILESSVTTNYSDGTSKTRSIEGELPPSSKKDFSPIGRRSIDVTPGTEVRNFTSSQFKEFCTYHNQELSPEIMGLIDKIFPLYKTHEKEMSVLIALLFGYDFMSQGLDDDEFHFSSPCSSEEVFLTLRDIKASASKLLHEFDKCNYHA